MFTFVRLLQRKVSNIKGLMGRVGGLSGVIKNKSKL